MKPDSISLITFEKQKNRVNNERLGCELKIFLQHLIDKNSITNNHELLIEVSKNDNMKNTTLFNTMGFKRGPISIHSPTYFFTQKVGDFMNNNKCGNNIVKNVKNKITITESTLNNLQSTGRKSTNPTKATNNKRLKLIQNINKTIDLLNQCSEKTEVMKSIQLLTKVKTGLEPIKLDVTNFSYFLMDILKEVDQKIMYRT